MTTAQRPETVLVRGGKYDGWEVPFRGMWCEIPLEEPTPEGFEYQALPWAQDPDGSYFANGNVGDTYD